jgi:ferredoxin
VIVGHASERFTRGYYDRATRFYPGPLFGGSKQIGIGRDWGTKALESRTIASAAPALGARPEREKVTMKVRVDAQICQGHTLCAMAAPDLFVLSDEDGHASAVSEDVPAGKEGLAQDAARSCPEQAIVIF